MTQRVETEALLPLSPVVYQTLVALAEGPRHGYAIAQDVEAVTGGRIRMGPGTLYGSLQRMQKAGLIEESGASSERGGHSERRRYYALTKLGRAALSAETSRLEAAVNVAKARLASGA